ncbi:DNA replication complex GINS family protein [Candidatus Bathyarchaeota archaeon]|nr:DNA replication complex GINS family protein [Candidatus Bathyarchaeota archaeon]
MYNELYYAWKRELENTELQKLSSDFYSKIADYVMKSREESRMLDKRTVKAYLLRKEMENAKRMINDLVWMRYKKLIRKVSIGARIPVDALTTEEAKIFAGISPFTEAYIRLTKDILSGHMLQGIAEQSRKRDVLRFLREIPAIIGVDMKTYGHFKPDDVASLPIENAKIMVTQKLAERIEINYA